MRPAPPIDGSDGMTIMDTHTIRPDVRIDVFLDGRFVRSARLDPDETSRESLRGRAFA
jgi:hypothetical protein